MLPVAQALIVMLGRRQLVFVIDGSTVGRGCMCLMISVLYQRRALPITWLVVKARKAHLPEALHCALLEQLAQLVPAEASVTILGDGEYGGANWHAAITARGWTYVARVMGGERLRRDYCARVDVCLPNCKRYPADAGGGNYCDWRSRAEVWRDYRSRAGLHNGRTVRSGQHAGGVGSGLRASNLSGDDAR